MDQNLLLIFKNLKNCPQNPEHHPEGNVWNHTLLVCNEATKYLREIPEDWQLAFVIGALLHDIGKPATIDPKTLTTYSHDKVGAELAKDFLTAIGCNSDIIEKVYGIVKGHMRPKQLIKQNASIKAWQRLNKICRLDILAYMGVCDADGRMFPPKGKDEAFKFIIDMYNKLKEEENEQKVVT